MRQTCPCSNANAAPLANANLKPIVVCPGDLYDPTAKCGTACGGNANLKPLAACPGQLCVEDPYGTQCVKSLAEQSACPPFQCPVPVVNLTPCKTLVNSLTCCNPRNPNLNTAAVRNCCTTKSSKGFSKHRTGHHDSSSSSSSRKSHKSHKSNAPVPAVAQ